MIKYMTLLNPSLHLFHLHFHQSFCFNPIILLFHFISSKHHCNVLVYFGIFSNQVSYHSIPLRWEEVKFWNFHFPWSVPIALSHVVHLLMHSFPHNVLYYFKKRRRGKVGIWKKLLQCHRSKKVHMKFLINSCHFHM